MDMRSLTEAQILWEIDSGLSWCVCICCCLHVSLSVRMCWLYRVLFKYSCIWEKLRKRNMQRALWRIVINTWFVKTLCHISSSHFYLDAEKRHETRKKRAFNATLIIMLTDILIRFPPAPTKKMWNKCICYFSSFFLSFYRCGVVKIVASVVEANQIYPCDPNHWLLADSTNAVNKKSKCIWWKREIAAKINKRVNKLIAYHLISADTLGCC